MTLALDARGNVQLRKSPADAHGAFWSSPECGAGLCGSPPHTRTSGLQCRTPQDLAQHTAGQEKLQLQHSNRLLACRHSQSSEVASSHPVKECP